MKNARQNIARIGSVIALALWLSPATQADPAKTVRIGVLPLTSNAFVYLAIERGYFTQEGLAVELKKFDASAPVAVAGASGDIDLGVTAVTGAMLNLAGGQAIKIVAGSVSEVPNFPDLLYIVNGKAFDDGFRAPKDFAGRTVGVAEIGSPQHYSLGLLAEKYHFPLDEVKVVPLQSLSNQVSALKGGRIDAALLPVAVALPVIDSGPEKSIGSVGDETPWQAGAIFASKAALADRVMLTRILAALRRGARTSYDVLLAQEVNGKVPINEATRPALETISHFTNLPVERIAVGLPYVDPALHLSIAKLQTLLDWFQQHNFANRGFTAQDIVDIQSGYAMPD